jgi:ElaB/YqjD/DUF883 family membrane-anchored ribosome-binding protein
MSTKEENFSEEYKKFQMKIHNFVLQNDFAGKTQQYEELFNQMASVAPDDMKEYIQKSPTFLKARNESLELMERIVALHKGLEKIFKMDEQELAKMCDYDLDQIDERIGKDIKESANLLHRFNIVSEAGRKAIKMSDDPFLSQGMQS